MKLMSHPEIMDGAVCFSDTRIPVQAVWEFAASGYTAGQISLEYPSLHVESIAAAIGLVEWWIPGNSKEDQADG